jgi:hypothetical protein
MRTAVKRTVQGFTGTAILVGGIALTGTPALADAYQCWQNGPALSCVARGKVTDSNTHVQACDERADGKGARVWYIDSNNVHRYVSDSNGSGANGCGHAYTSTSNRVTYFRVCLVDGDNEDCRDWVRV